MRKLPVFVLALLIAVAAVGCDSNEDDASDAELFVGTWVLTSISDDTGDQTDGFAGLANALTVDLEDGGSFTLVLDYREDSGRQDLVLQGNYEVDADANSLELTLPTTQTLPFEYDFENENEVDLTASADFINPIFNPTTDYEGTVTVEIERQ